MVLVMGDVMWDYQYWVRTYPEVGDDEQILMDHQGIGGSATNTAIALRSQNIPVTLVARLGPDAVGQKILANLGGLGLDLGFMQFGESTGYTVTIIDTIGERTMFSNRGASAQVLELTRDLKRKLRETPLLFLSGYYLLGEEQGRLALQVAEITKNNGGLVAFDPSPMIKVVPRDVLGEFLALTDLILPNQRELQLLTSTSDVLSGLEQLGEKIPGIGLKLGSQGSRLYLRKGFPLMNGKVLNNSVDIFEPALEVEPLDTTGAGDAFNGGLLGALLKGEAVDTWLRKGNSLAAQVIGEKGASSFFFWKDRLFPYLLRNRR